VLLLLLLLRVAVDVAPPALAQILPLIPGIPSATAAAAAAARHLGTAHWDHLRVGRGKALDDEVHADAARLVRGSDRSAVSTGLPHHG
jgi:hypothetical protein